MIKCDNILIDIHVHSQFKRHPDINGLNNSFQDPDSLIEIMDKANITKAVVLPVISPECKYTIVTPEEVITICSKYPSRLIPFCNFDPRCLNNSIKSEFRHLLSAYKELGCKGVGEYFPNIPLDDPLNTNFFRQVEEIGFPITFHLAAKIGEGYGCYDDPGLPRLEKILKMFPKLIFLGHSQVFWAEIGRLEITDNRTRYPKGKILKEGRVVELMRKYQNLHGDLSALSGYNAVSRDHEFGYKFLEEFQDKLYWGTDITIFSLNTPLVNYFRFLKSQKLISDEAYNKITWKNAEKLLFNK